MRSAERTDRLDDFLVLGKTPGFLLAEDACAIDVDVKVTAAALDQFGVNLEFLLQCGGQTGRLRQVVSFHTVFNRNMHILLPVASNFPLIIQNCDPRPQPRAQLHRFV